jgi:uncharacterized protein YbjT (DUF2867 family)
MQVFVTGATGFVGHEVIRQLLRAGHRPVCLVRPGSEEKLPSASVDVRSGDVTRPETLRGALNGCEAVIHLVGIIREYPRQGVTFERLHIEATANMMAAAQAQKVPRFIQMSSNGAEADGRTAYYRTKWQAEQHLKASSLDWTIFRPSIMYGKEDNFCTMLAGMVRVLPAVPVFGDGSYRLAPVAVEDRGQLGSRRCLRADLSLLRRQGRHLRRIARSDRRYPASSQGCQGAPADLARKASAGPFTVSTGLSFDRRSVADAVGREYLRPSRLAKVFRSQLSFSKGGIAAGSRPLTTASGSLPRAR